MKESSGSETYRKSDSIKGSNWKLNLSTSQLSAQHKSSNKMIDPNESLHLLAANNSKLGTPSGASIADYLSKRLRSNLQKHENEMRKLKQLKETVSDEILFNEKYFKTQHLPSVNPQSSYGLEDEAVNEDPYYNALMQRDVQIVAKPFTIRQSSCYACLNKFRCKNVIPKIPTLMASKPSNWFESAKTHVNYYNCPSDVLFLNNNISYQSTDAINRILNNFIHDTENKGFGMYDEEPVLTTIVKKHEDSPPPTKRTLHGGRIAAGGTSPTLDTSSVADDGVYCFPTQSVYSDQTFFRNSAWPLKLLNDNELYTMVFKDVNLKKLEERIAKIEVKKRLDKFLNSP
ncbi:uncharacterized protein LOC123300394 [Chrysoperla carnea]|uniref:uncharacterized protein LOC123300394 n=1 Tax=Chrysoperla carnea TaxID=189513 RepID=UPI001D072004|nr:uncharacterized protein LOC123300394 [Chrysoperla carnea]